MLSNSNNTTTKRPSTAISKTSSTERVSPFQKKNKMSLTQTYSLAHTARGKLSKEAARTEYNLRVLVGHANLLDGLMLELADAERQQESWFNASVRTASSQTTTSSRPSPSPTKHISWTDALPPAIEEEEDDEDEELDEDSESDSSDDEDEDMSLYEHNAEAVHVEAMEVDDTADDDDEAANDGLTLVRTRSHSPASPPPTSPPGLISHESDCSDSDDYESDDDQHMPPSPTTPTDMDLDLAAMNATLLKTAEHYQATHQHALAGRADVWQRQGPAVAVF